MSRGAAATETPLLITAGLDPGPISTAFDYPAVHALHYGAVLMSGSLFLVRGVAVQASAGWAMAAPARYASYAIDTVLLVAALALFAMLPAEVFENGWLWVKLMLLVAYIVAGSFALKRGRSLLQKRLAFLLALVLYAGIFSIAISRDPLAPLQLLSPFLFFG